MITMMIEVIGVGPSSPIRLLPQPHWKTATRTPYAAPIESRFIDGGLQRDHDRPEHQHQQQERDSDDGADEERQGLPQLGVEVVGDRGDPGDVDVAGDQVADLLDGDRGLGVGRARGRDRA